MQFMLMQRADQRTEEVGKPDPEATARVNRVIHEMLGAGVLLAADGLMPGSAPDVRRG